MISSTSLGAYRLKDERRKIFFTKFEERLNEEINHPVFGYKATYRRCIELQARLLAKFLTGEIEEYPPLLYQVGRKPMRKITRDQQADDLLCDCL